MEHYSAPMALLFPNSSRVHDEARHTVQFWGYDAIAEVLFRITEGALARINAEALDPAGFLRTFDQHRDRILEAAQRAYARRRQGSYRLVAAAF